MFVHKSLAGVAAATLAGATLVLSAGAAHAAVDPDDTTFTPTTTDVIGVGSDTSQNALFRLANSFNAQVPAPTNRLATFAATGGGTIPLPTAAVTRPNGSGSGKATLFGAGNNTDIDFARASNSLSSGEVSAGLQQFPFALDTLKLAVSGTVASNAPAMITPAQMVSIYKGDVTNWSAIGGTPGTIVPMIPQAGSGTRSFFVSQLQAANGGTAVTLAASVVEVQEHDAAPIQSNPNAVAPFSAGRAGLAGTALRLETGFFADRALYNVVRSTDVGKPEILALFGESGFVCSDAANDEIAAAGFKQLDSPADGGVCGAVTQTATSNFDINQPVVAIPTTTTLTGTSPAAKALRLVATVAGSTTPTGSVAFTSGATSLGTVTLIGGTATLNLTGSAPGTYPVLATYTPTPGSAFVASEQRSTVVVKAASSIKESFPTSVKGKRSVSGVVTVDLIDSATNATGKVTLKEGSKKVGTGTLVRGKVTIKLLKSKLGAGKSKVKITWPGNARAFGSAKSFSITFKK